jgi:phosphate transport system substrate-binding protein
MKKVLFAALAASLISSAASARDYVSIAGSSTVLPFATIVAEQLGTNPEFKTPVVESGGSSVGKKGVCQGIGTEYIDIGNASSRMKTKELAYCDTNGVTVTEIKVGYDGIVVAHSKNAEPLNISKKELGMALTAQIPACYEGSGRNYNCDEWIDNPFKKWSDINPALPDIAIRVMGPPTTSGTRASYVEMVNQKGYCGKDSIAKAASKARGDKKGKLCRAMRTDGAYIEAGEQDNLIVQKLLEDEGTYGIFGFSYLDQNSDTLSGAIIDGGEPTFEAIASGDYAVSRSLYFYVKHAHVGVVPGVDAYMNEWTKHWGEDGMLADAGMIPLPEAEMEEMISRMENLPALTADDLK